MRISDWSSDVCSSDLRPIDDFLLGRPSSRLVGISGTGRLLKIGIVVAVVGAGSVGWYLHAEHQRALEEQVRIAEALRLVEERSRAAATAAGVNIPTPPWEGQPLGVAFLESGADGMRTIGFGNGGWKRAGRYCSAGSVQAERKAEGETG